jgi:hypothetical protein
VGARGRFAWVWAAAGALGVYLARRRRRPAASSAELSRPPGVDPRAAELRRRLDESRSLVDEREEFEAGETSIDRAEPAATNVDERRRLVHEHGRGAVETMRQRHEERRAEE